MTVFQRPGGGLLFGLILAAVVIGGSFIGDLLIGPAAYTLHVTHTLEGPTLRFPLGTDALGRDMLARLVSGGAATLEVSLPAALLTFAVGTLYGVLAGLGPRWLDQAMMRILDAVLALPALIVLIFFASIVPLGVVTLILLLGLVSWPALARLVRNEAVAQRDRDFVLASRQLGAGTWHLARAHLLRVMAPILVVNATLLVGDMIFFLSALSFLGLGVQPPLTSWGGLLENGLTLLAISPWWLIVPPGLAILCAILAASLIGEGLLAARRQAR